MVRVLRSGVKRLQWSYRVCIRCWIRRSWEKLRIGKKEWSGEWTSRKKNQIGENFSWLGCASAGAYAYHRGFNILSLLILSTRIMYFTIAQTPLHTTFFEIEKVASREWEEENFWYNWLIFRKKINGILRVQGRCSSWGVSCRNSGDWPNTAEPNRKTCLEVDQDGADIILRDLVWRRDLMVKVDMSSIEFQEKSHLIP